MYSVSCRSWCGWSRCLLDRSYCRSCILDFVRHRHNAMEEAVAATAATAAASSYMLALLAVTVASGATLAIICLRQRAVHDAPWIAAIRTILHEAGPGVDLPVEILPHLLLGDKRAANDLTTIDAFGVTHILNMAGKSGRTEHVGSRCYLKIDADDEEGYPIVRRHLDEATAFIQRARSEGGRVLVHCQAGINRSGVIATAELMLSEQLPVIEAVRRVKAARGVLLSNHSFQAQLVALARERGLLGERPANFQDERVHMRQPRRSAAEALRALG